jgi:uncharacterized membrane protein YoaK (UPF0700 family)
VANEKPQQARLMLLAMLALTFVTGIVDAVGFLALDRVFAGNMTGNIVVLGLGLAGADGLPVLGPAVALAAFTVGSLVAGSVLEFGRRKAPAKGWHHRVTVLLSLGAVVLTGLTAATALTGQHPSTDMQVLLAAATAAVMGLQAVVARTLAVKDMTTVVVTSTLASLAGETWPSGTTSVLLNRRAAAIAAIFLGALTGALLLQLHIALPFGAAASITVAVVLVGHRALHNDRPEARPHRVIDAADQPASPAT